MHYHRPRPLPESQRLHSKVKRAARNRRQKRKLIENGHSHGVLVYLEGEPVGWCQYGPKDELPRIDNDRNYRGLAPEGKVKLWRITCFVVHKRHRKRGIATAALKAALRAIEEKGGGLVEAYPMIKWGAYRDWFGTASIFRHEGFRVVAPFGKSNVLMRRAI
jgi:GNAT superfamily N-acetyltransferase